MVLRKDLIKFIIPAAVGLALIGWGIMMPENNAPGKTAARKTASVNTVPLATVPAESYYNFKTDDRKKLINTVVKFCSKNYNAPNCIHYLVKCGRPCLADINQKEQERVLADYKKLRVKLGLGPLRTSSL